MKNIFLVMLIISSFNTVLACSIQYVETYDTKPLKFKNGKWHEIILESPKVSTSNKFKQLYDKYSIVFSGTMATRMSNNNMVRKIVFTNKIWKGHVTEIVEYYRVMDSNPCGEWGIIPENKEFVFFAEIGTRKKLIKIYNSAPYDDEAKEFLKEPISQWVRGRFIEEKPSEYSEGPFLK